MTKAIREGIRKTESPCLPGDWVEVQYFDGDAVLEIVDWTGGVVGYNREGEPCICDWDEEELAYRVRAIGGWAFPSVPSAREFIRDRASRSQDPLFRRPAEKLLADPQGQYAFLEPTS